MQVEGYFSSECDKTIIEVGGFFCQACIVAHLRSQQSPDPRYCLNCCDLLLKEAALDKSWRRSAWQPVIQPFNKALQGLPGVEKAMTPTGLPTAKKSTLKEDSITVDIFRPRGRSKTYKKKALPEDIIRQLHSDGMGSRAIATGLKVEHNIHVSYKTIQRMLKGERKPATIRG